MRGGIRPAGSRNAAGLDRARSAFRKALLCTLGPSSMDPRIIRRLEAAGVTSFRINMSHTTIGDLGREIRLIQECTEAPICLDSEGRQIRTGLMKPGVTLARGACVRLVADGSEGDTTAVSISPGSAVRGLRRGARLSVDFDSAVLRVDRIADGVVEAMVVIGGEVGSRKAVTAYPSPQLPTFSGKDLEAIRLAKRQGVEQFALSYCDSEDAVRQLRSMVGPDSTIMAKIESREGVRNLPRIAQSADRIIIDRGDLSREVRLEAIPLLQKAIIRRARALGVPVYVATNLLESMVTRRTPTRAEVNDVINTLIDGADGLVLAAETAIGRYPVEAAKMIATLLKEYEGSIEGYHLDDLLGTHPLAVR